MANFFENATHETGEPRITVELNEEKFLPVGTHKFRLVVEDNAGLQSEPAIVEVFVRDTNKPTARGRAVPAKPEAGVPFELDASESADLPPGKIVKYIWTLME